MLKLLKSKGFIAFFLLPLVLAAPVRAAETPTYGQLMLIEKKEATPSTWQVEASGMQEFSNPYLNVLGVSLSVKKSIGHFFHVGPEATFYSTSESDVNREVEAALQTESIRQNVFRPRNSIYGVVSVVPISGHLNWFSASTLPVELSVSLGYGAVQYREKDSEGSLLWRVGPRAFVSEIVALQFQFGQEIESAFGGDSITRSHARIGVVARF